MCTIAFYWVPPGLLLGQIRFQATTACKVGIRIPRGNQTTGQWVTYPMHSELDSNAHRTLSTPEHIIHQAPSRRLPVYFEMQTPAIWGECGRGMPGTSQLDALLVRMTESRRDCICFLCVCYMLGRGRGRLRGDDEGLAGTSHSWSYRVTWTAFKNHQCPGSAWDQFSQNLGEQGTVGHRHSSLLKLAGDS